MSKENYFYSVGDDPTRYPFESTGVTPIGSAHSACEACEDFVGLKQLRRWGYDSLPTGLDWPLKFTVFETEDGPEKGRYKVNMEVSVFLNTEKV